MTSLDNKEKRGPLPRSLLTAVALFPNRLAERPLRLNIDCIELLAEADGGGCIGWPIKYGLLSAPKGDAI